MILSINDLPWAAKLDVSLQGLLQGGIDRANELKGKAQEHMVKAIHALGETHNAEATPFYRQQMKEVLHLHLELVGVYERFGEQFMTEELPSMIRVLEQTIELCMERAELLNDAQKAAQANYQIISMYSEPVSRTLH